VRESVDSILVWLIDPGQPGVMLFECGLRANGVWKTLLSGREAWERSRIPLEVCRLSVEITYFTDPMIYMLWV
jgi:hypothetical protein